MSVSHLVDMELPKHCVKDSVSVSDQLILVVDNLQCRVFSKDIERGGKSKLNVTTIDLRGQGSLIKHAVAVISLVLCFLVAWVLVHRSHCEAFRYENEHFRQVGDFVQEKNQTTNSELDFIHKNIRKRRQVGQFNYTPPFAHLKGFHTPDDHIHEAHLDHGHIYLLWQEPHGPSEIEDVNVTYSSTTPVRRVLGLTVRHPGLYLVYSQVALHGRRRTSMNRHYHCSHTTMKIQEGQRRPTELLKSMVTQNFAGFRFRTSAGHRILASDTALQMGVFFLQTNDEIRVGFPMSCDHIDYRNDNESAYFGIVQLGML